MEITIRKVKAADYQEIASLWVNELGYKNVTPMSVADKFAMMDRHSAYETYVAESEGMIAGFISLAKALSFEVPVGYLKVEGLAVKKAYQGKKIGKQLLAFSEMLAKEKKLSYVFLDSKLHRTAAHEFYRTQGYETHSLCFTKDV